MLKRLGVGVALSLMLSACGGNDKPYVCNDPEAYKVFERLPEETQQVFADAIALYEADARVAEYESLLSSYTKNEYGLGRPVFLDSPKGSIGIYPTPIDERLDGANNIYWAILTADEGKVDEDGDGYSDFAFQCGVGNIERWDYVR